MADVYVNSEELKEVAQSMKLKANNIMEAYQNEASAAILMGSESIQVSGLDTTALLNSLSKIFNNLNGRIVSLSDFLTNVVANEYDNVSVAIKNEFDNNFANEISKILGISVIGAGVGGGTIIGKTPISDIVSGKIDNSEIISIREDGKIIKKNEPPIYEIPPQPKPKLETMNDGGGSNPVSDKSDIALPLKDSTRDSILPTRSTKATAVTQQEDEYVTQRAQYYAENKPIRVKTSTQPPSSKAAAVNQNNEYVTESARYNNETGGYVQSIKSNYASSNPTKAVSVTQSKSEYVTPSAEYYNKNGGYAASLNNNTTPAKTTTTTRTLPNVSQGNRRPQSVLDNDISSNF